MAFLDAMALPIALRCVLLLCLVCHVAPQASTTLPASYQTGLISWYDSETGVDIPNRK